MMAFPEYMQQMHDYLQKWDSNPEWAGQEFWRKEKERILIEVGERLEVGFTATQALAGNYLKHDRPTIFGSDEWEKGDTPYSFSLKTSRNHVNDFMKFLFNESGDPNLTKYKEMLEFNGYEYGKTADALKEEQKKPGKFKEMNQLCENFLTEQTGGRYFQNTDLVEKALNQYINTRN